MTDKNLVEGFDQNSQEEKEEIRIYGLKQKQKAKKRINLIFNFILGFILFTSIIYILNLNNKIAQKDYEIKILTEGNKDLILSLNSNKENIDKMSNQNTLIQNKAFSFLNKCYNETTTLNNEIKLLKEEIIENEKNNKIKLEEMMKKNIDLRDKLRYMDDYYNIC